MSKENLQRLSYSVEEAAHVLGLSKSQIYDLINRGAIRSVKSPLLGKRRLVTHAECVRFLEENQEAA